MPFTDVTGKTREECNPLCSWDSFEKRVHAKLLGEVGPMSPISQADFLSLSHDPIGGVSLSSTEKTREVTVSCSRSMGQEASCGSGKSELNLVRNAVSDRS